jgi:predicted dehydrogenase
MPAGGFSVTGGGVLRDFGSHVADQALRLFGPVAAVYAEIHVVPGQGDFDDRFFLSMRHASGVTSRLWGDWALHGAAGPRFRVVGSTGTFAVEPDDGQAERLLSGRTPAIEGETFGTVPEARWVGSTGVMRLTARSCRPGGAAGAASTRRSPGRCGALASCR